MDLNEPDRKVELQEHTERRSCLGVAFVCNNYRQQGIATALMQAVAEYTGVSIRDMVNVLPFSPEGESLARQFSVELMGSCW